jgi:hypothetical protein
MKRKPTKQEERQFLKTIKDGFLIGIKSLLERPMYKNIDFTQTLKDAKKRGEISINKNGVILYHWDPTTHVGDIPSGVYDANVINNPHSKNEMVKKSQLKPVIKEVLKELYRQRSRASSTYDDYETEFEALVIPGLSTENDTVKVSISIGYNADAGEPARGMFGPPEYSSPGEGPSVEIVDSWPTSVRIQDKSGKETEYDPNKLTKEQQIIIKKAIDDHVSQNDEKITDMILDTLDFDSGSYEPDFNDVDERVGEVVSPKYVESRSLRFAGTRMIKYLTAIGVTTIEKWNIHEHDAKTIRLQVYFKLLKSREIRKLLSFAGTYRSEMRMYAYKDLVGMDFTINKENIQ